MKIHGRSDRTIEPGKAEEVTIGIKSSYRGGRTTKRVRVHSNDRENQQIMLQCVADVKVALKMTPHIANFGQVERSAEAQTRTIKIKAGDGGPISPKIISTGNENVTAELREVKAGEEYAMDVTISPPWPNRMLRGRLQIETGVKESPKEFVTVFARVAQRLAASPSRLNIPPQISQDLTMRARLRWGSGPPANITAVEIDDPDLSVEVTSDNPAAPVVALHIPEGYSTTRMKRLKIKVHTDDPDVPVLEIPVYATRSRALRQPAVRQRGATAGPKVVKPPRMSPRNRAQPAKEPASNTDGE